MSSDTYALEIINDSDSFVSLKEDWDDLFARADKPYFSQSFNWNWRVWETVARPQGNRLHCLVIRCRGRVVLIWPVVVHSHRGFWTLACPLGSGHREYTDVLVDRAYEGSELAALAWQRLRKTCESDLIRLSDVRGDSYLYRMMAGENAPKTQRHPAPYTSFDGYQSWDVYYRSLKGDDRRENARCRRRLAELGQLTYQLVTQGGEYQSMLNWLLDQKRQWLIRKGYDAPRFHSTEYQNFLSQIVNYGGIDGKIVMWALKLDETVIAAALGSIDTIRWEGLISGFDPRYRTYAAGLVLLEYTMQWAFERGLSIYDFRMGGEPYKQVWANRTCQMFDYELANSAWGNVYQSLRDAFLSGRELRKRWRGR